MKIVDLRPKQGAKTLRLYYFTGKHWGMKCLWEKRLKLARYSDLNDPFELCPFDLRKKKSQAFWQREIAQLLEAPQGLLCFSEAWQSTLMWSHYGEKHSGMCLGFDVPQAEAIRIRYISSLKPDPFEHKRAARGAASQALEDALHCKHRAWSHEKEWRMQVPLSNPVDGLFYKPFDGLLHLREVILGAKCSMTPAEVARAVINPPLDVEVFQARAELGSFAMCRHELIDTHTRTGFRAALALASPAYAHDLPDEG